MSRKVEPFNDLMKRIRVHPNASEPPPPGLAATVQLWPSVPSVDPHTVPHDVVPSIVLRWVVSPYAPVTVHSVALSPAVVSSTMSATELPAATQALCPPGPSPATVLAAGRHHSSLALTSAGSDNAGDAAQGCDDDHCESDGPKRCALCVIYGTKLLELFLALDDRSTLTIPVSNAVVHDVVCLNVDQHPQFCEAATLQLCAAVACALRATAVHFSGTVESYAAECFGKRKNDYHPRVVDMSGLTKLRSVCATSGFAPWRVPTRLVLPPLSPDGHEVDAHFGLAPMTELSFGTASRPSRLHHLGDNGFCFPKALRQVDFRPCPELRHVGSLTFQGAMSLRIVCFRGLQKMTSFGRRPFVQCGNLQLLDLRDMPMIPRIDDVLFDKTFKGVVLVSDDKTSECAELHRNIETTARGIEPGTEDAYPPDVLVPDPNDDTRRVLRVALSETQYHSLPPFAPIPLHVECLCAHDHNEHVHAANATVSDAPKKKSIFRRAIEALPI